MKNEIFSGKWGKCHCQGMTMDRERRYIYYSFTTVLVKTDIDGNLIGYVENIAGHLGCIDYCDADGKVYASLEYKNDAIGKGILGRIGKADVKLRDGFYIAIFDGDKIDRPGMNAATDGVMTVAYLKTVYDDYSGSVTTDGGTVPHIHGCSGIDGLAIGPDFGDRGGKEYLHVCYGVYGDETRADNDYQVILQYEIAELNAAAKPLDEADMHRFGVENPRNKYYLYTGNTTYGVQNLEYDEFTGDYFACVYTGHKPQFPNYPMFVIDGGKAAEEKPLVGCGGETGRVLSLKETGEAKNGISGINFPLGSMGVHSLGDGEFCFVDPVWDDPDNLSVNCVRYRLTGTDGKLAFIKV